MKLVNKDRKRPEDAERLQALEPVICYNPARIENYNFSIYFHESLSEIFAKDFSVDVPDNNVPVPDPPQFLAARLPSPPR